MSNRSMSLVAMLVLFAVATPGTASTNPADLADKSLAPAGVWLDEMDLSRFSSGWGVAQARQSVEGRPITIGGMRFARGVGTHAASEVAIGLHAQALRFVSAVGVDDEVGTQGSVVFEAWVDGRKAADSGIMRGGDAPKVIDVDIAGAWELILKIDVADKGNGWDHADWAGARIIMQPDADKKPVMLPDESEEDHLPIAQGLPDGLSINGPRAVGTTPGRPFLFLIPASGGTGIRFEVKDMPAGLQLNSTTGVISGSIKSSGIYEVSLVASADGHSAVRTLCIVAGEHKLALTPPMGWNSWNAWGCDVDAEKVRAAIDAMVDSGLASAGYRYINIDDCWEAERDEKGYIQTNAKFPDMKVLADYAHSKGLLLGIYSSPGPKTCAGYMGSYGHEQQDVDTWAEWGIDYLKYDWCYYEQIAQDHSLEELRKPYVLMRQCLENCSRDIVYSLCQYGMGDVWTWGAEVGGNLWRTTGDITDTWASMAEIGFAHHAMSPYAGPGHWNDPDMLVVGKVGWGANVRPTRLTHNEQITHMTLWSLLAAPLLIGCDMSQLDSFTKNLLMNTEVIDVNQDPLGKPATRMMQERQAEVWARPLWDGTWAVGLFNRSYRSALVTACFTPLGLKGPQPVRNVWQKQDLGKFHGSYSARIPAHGAVFLKVGQSQHNSRLSDLYE